MTRKLKEARQALHLLRQQKPRPPAARKRQHDLGPTEGSKGHPDRDRLREVDGDSDGGELAGECQLSSLFLDTYFESHLRVRR